MHDPAPASTLTKFNARRQSQTLSQLRESYTCSTMHDEQYSQIFTNYLIIDTCLFLNSGELIARILISIWLKKLSFKIVVPIVVRLELERQAVSYNLLNTYSGLVLLSNPL